MLRRLPTRLSFHALRLGASPTAQRKKERKRDRDKIRRKDRVQEGVIMYQRQQRKRKRKQHWSIRGGGAWCWRGRNQGAQWRDESNKTTCSCLFTQTLKLAIVYLSCLHKSVISEPDRISRLMNYSIQSIGCFRSQMYPINHSGPVAVFFGTHFTCYSTVTDTRCGKLPIRSWSFSTFRCKILVHLGSIVSQNLIPQLGRLFFFFRPQIFCMYTSYETTPKAGLTFYL